jgi:replication factor C subunit 3/5
VNDTYILIVTYLQISTNFLVVSFIFYLDIFSEQTSKGLSLLDIVTFIHELILLLKLPPIALVYILSELSEIEYRLSHGTNEKIQLSSFVSIFQVVKQIIQKLK